MDLKGVSSIFMKFESLHHRKNTFQIPWNDQPGAVTSAKARHILSELTSWIKRQRVKKNLVMACRPMMCREAPHKVALRFQGKMRFIRDCSIGL